MIFSIKKKIFKRNITTTDYYCYYQPEQPQQKTIAVLIHPVWILSRREKRRADNGAALCLLSWRGQRPFTLAREMAAATYRILGTELFYHALHSNGTVIGHFLGGWYPSSLLVSTKQTSSIQMPTLGSKPYVGEPVQSGMVLLV